jgi:hypothetical protein
VANALQLGLVGLSDTEHLGVTGDGESQPQQYPVREKQSAKGLRTYFKTGSLAVIRLSIGISGAVSSCLSGRSRFGASREVGLALFQESGERLFCVFGADLHTELFVLGLHRGLDLLAR